MNCKAGDLAMLVRPIPHSTALGIDPMWLVGRAFKLTRLAADFEEPCWLYEGPQPTITIRVCDGAMELIQVALPDSCLMPIDPPGDAIEFSDTVPVSRESPEIEGCEVLT